ncbi:hypothetical protein K227x_13270 [Rubripirellula lacrimiformis]|uniref:Protein-glutamine gamma-glutamyltransferase-like C-terminal domain-containing protein n=1 Tax=Rubripirellula lacrimiformis TaxID=1930273 RepID=A0A517N7H7_9BACT|nr:DUF4129 domain-containing protein [Rubripirellula lacrimiformis]QDT02948.1 hypothetical protein K227x_13270 [Rubripirellula lacrimiformis]
MSTSALFRCTCLAAILLGGSPVSVSAAEVANSPVANSPVASSPVANSPVANSPVDRASVDGASVDAAGVSVKVDDSVSSSVWYDADQRSVLPVDVTPQVDDTLHRDSRWLPKPERVVKPDAPQAAPGTTWNSNGLFGSGMSLSNLLGWLVLLTLFALGIGLVIYAMSKAEIDLITNARLRAVDDQGDGTPDEQTLQRIKHLPAELRRTDVNLRSEAQRLMEAGQYDQAIILLFGHQLLLLDRVGMIRLNRGKTNRKYVRETQATVPDLARRLQATVDGFEKSYFGRHAVTANEFAMLWESNERMENVLQTRVGGAI